MVIGSDKHLDLDESEYRHENAEDLTNDSDDNNGESNDTTDDLQTHPVPSTALASQTIALRLKLIQETSLLIASVLWNATAMKNQLDFNLKARSKSMS